MSFVDVLLVPSLFTARVLASLLETNVPSYVGEVPVWPKRLMLILLFVGGLLLHFRRLHIHTSMICTRTLICVECCACLLVVMRERCCLLGLLVFSAFSSQCLPTRITLCVVCMRFLEDHPLTLFLFVRLARLL